MSRGDGGELVWVMPFREQVVGRPGYLHGGAIAGLLEFAALGTLYDALGSREGVIVKPINVTVDFMRGGIDHETYASAVVTRLGNRVANVEAHAWQQDRRSEEHTSELQSLMRISYAVFCLKKKTHRNSKTHTRSK